MIRRPVRREPLHEQALGRSRLLSRRGRNRHRCHAEVGVRHRPVCYQVVRNLHRRVDGDGEPEADVAAAAVGHDGAGGGDADQLARTVDQRPAAVARVDRRIRLDRGHQQRRPAGIAGDMDVSVEGADDPRRNGARQPQRRTQRDNRLTDLHGAGLADADHPEVEGRRQVQYGQVGLGIAAGDGGVDLGAVGEEHLDVTAVRGVRDDVVVGEDVPVGTDHLSRPGARAGRSVGADLDDRGQHLVGDRGRIAHGGRRRVRRARPMSECVDPACDQYHEHDRGEYQSVWRATAAATLGVHGRSSGNGACNLPDESSGFSRPPASHNRQRTPGPRASRGLLSAR